MEICSHTHTCLYRHSHAHVDKCDVFSFLFSAGVEFDQYFKIINFSVFKLFHIKTQKA